MKKFDETVKEMMNESTDSKKLIKDLIKLEEKYNSSGNIYLLGNLSIVDDEGKVIDSYNFTTDSYKKKTTPIG